jgi:tetratricopeptide (TPR) repeat protein
MARKAMRNAVELFVSSAPGDAALRDALVEHLAFLSHEGLVREAAAPAEAPAERAVDARLGSADLVLLLISPEALAPGTSTEAEMRMALDMEREGRAVVVPVKLRAAALEDGPLAGRALVPVGSPLASREDRLAALREIEAAVLTGVSLCHVRVGDILLARERDAAAAASFRTALSIADRVLAGDPTREDRLTHVALVRDRLGEALLAGGDGPGALAEFDAARGAREHLLSLAPEDERRRNALARSLESMGEVLRAMGEKKLALEAFRGCLALRHAIAESAPSAEATREVYLTQARMGHVLRTMGDVEGALAVFRVGMELSEALFEQASLAAASRADHALFCFRAATVLAEGTPEQREEARSLLRRALALYSALANEGQMPEGQEIWPPAVESLLDSIVDV